MTEQQTQTPRAEMAVTGNNQIVPFIHRLGVMDVEVTAYDAAGKRVGYLMVNPISTEEAEILLAPDVAYAKLVAVPATEDDDEDDGQGIHPEDAFGY